MEELLVRVKDSQALPMRIIVILVFALFTTAAAAQNEPELETRKAVGACYAGCVAEAHRTGKDVLDSFMRMATFLASPAALYSEVDDWFSAATLNTCLLAQSHVLSMDTCRGGCYELENALGGKVGPQPKARFWTVFNRAKRNTENVGLWGKDHRDMPEGAVLRQACDELFSLDGKSGTAAVTAAREANRQTMVPCPSEWVLSRSSGAG